jgi:hypothetical protein
LVDSPHTLEPPWTEVGGIYRRVCILKSTGRPAEARRIEETELDAALAGVRQAAEGRAETEARIAAVMAAESERVAAAVTLAEILAPMLAERLGAAAPAAKRAAEPPEKTRARRAADEDRGIADFIEEMLVQDRAASA